MNNIKKTSNDQISRTNVLNTKSLPHRLHNTQNVNSAAKRLVDSKKFIQNAKQTWKYFNETSDLYSIVSEAAQLQISPAEECETPSVVETIISLPNCDSNHIQKLQDEYI